MVAGRRKVIGVVVGLLVLLGAAAWHVWRQPETTPALRGKEVARRMGCFVCHGPAGLGGIADPGAPSGRVPGWDRGTVAMYVRSEEEIREWILFGAPRSAGDETRDTAGLIVMPAYEGDLSDQELEDLVAYFRAVSRWAPDIPDQAYEGSRVAARLGCFGCHGHSGMGGGPNPGSFKGHIPPWDGAEYEDLVEDEDDLREWILDGRTARLWGNPAARLFLEGQKIKMPAFREHISKPELEQLVAYFRWLRSR